MKTSISIILNTARSGNAMIGFPNVHHFNYTIGALRQQMFKDFELIISDYIYDRRNFDWNTIDLTMNPFPIYHVPITHSQAHRDNYVAIAGTKNNGIMFAEGRLLFFLDDCSHLNGRLLQDIFDLYIRRGLFPNPLHIKDMGADFARTADDKIVQDCRFQLLDHHGVDEMIDTFHMYGYATMSLEAALRLNGYSEIFDFSRQMEDQSMGERLKAAGYHISLHRNLVVKEQEHLQLSPQPVGKPGINTWSEADEDEIRFGPSLKCNGPFFYIEQERQGEDRIKANHRGLNAAERAKVKPCYLLDGTLCKASNLPCNWLDGEGRDRHMALPESERIFSNPPIFNLAEERQKRLLTKESFRVK